MGIVTVCADHARKKGHKLRQPVDEPIWRTRYRDAESPTSLLPGLTPEPQQDAPFSKPVLDWDPYDLGIHRSITVAALLGDRLPELTPYLLRPLDKKLRELLIGSVRNQMVVLVGESSTGKTRGMFEAVRECLADWSLVHPLDVTELLALAAPGALPPRCVVWLNESQRYLDESRAAMVLRRLLRRPDQVVLVGSLWPEEWDRFVAKPYGEAPDVYRLTRELLGVAHQVLVPRALTENELKELDSPELRDPRWSTARQTSGDRRRAIQVLAGGVHLAQRYDHGPAATTRYSSPPTTATPADPRGRGDHAVCEPHWSLPLGPPPPVRGALAVGGASVAVALCTRMGVVCR